MGYLLNAFTVTTILLLLANILNISLFPSVGQAVESTGRSLGNFISGLKEGRSLELADMDRLGTVVDNALEIFSSLNSQDHEVPDHHVWKVEDDV